MNGAGSADVVSAQEQANADLVLLRQNLLKSKMVTARMTGLLTGFDDHLARLEKSVVPIHKSTKDLSKIQRNVEAALLAIEAVVGTNDLVDREQEVIDRQPKDDLLAYQASLNRLKAALESMQKSAGAMAQQGSPDLMRGKGKEREGTVGRVKALIDTGCQRLGDLFLDHLQAASPKPGWLDIVSWDAESGPFPTLMPQQTINTLISLLHFIRSILGKDNQVEKDLQEEYGETRGMFMATTLNHVSREVVDGIEVQTKAGNFTAGRLPALGRRGFGRFMDAMFAMAKSEHNLAGQIFEKQNANRIYSFIVPPALTIFTSTGTSINSAIKNTLTTNPTSVGVAFTCYTEMNSPSRIDNFEDWMRSKAGRRDNELNHLSHAFRGSCLRSLPEFLADTRAWGNKQLAGAEQTNANVNAMSINVVNFTKQICEFPDAAESFLATLGDGNWLPSSKASNGPPSARDPLDAGVLLPKYLHDVVQVLLQALDARARSMAAVRGSASSTGVLKNKDMYLSGSTANRQSQGLSAIFLLNNVAYVRRELLLNSNVPDLIAGTSSRRDSASTSGGGADVSIEDELNKRHRTAKALYLEIFSPLVSCLMDAGMEQSMLKSAIGVGNTEKKDTKDRFARFNDALDEIEQLHKAAKLDRNENQLRERVKDEVVRMCVPTYTAFVKKHEGFSKNPSKHVRVDPAGLQARLERLFAG